MEGLKKAFFLVAVFVFFYSAFGAFNFFSYGAVNNGQDFWFHWESVQGIESVHDYPPGYYALFSLFSFHQLAFYFANVVLVMAAIPLLVFWVSKKWWSVAVYFCGISLPHQLLYGATYPQAVVLVLLLAYLGFRRNWVLLAALTIAGVLVHDKAWVLFLAIWVFEAVLKLAPKNTNLAVGYLAPSQLQGLDGAIKLFLLQIPIPVFYFGLKGLRNGFYAGLICLSLVGSVHDFRAISVAQAVFAILAGGEISKLSARMKAGLALFLVFQAVFYLLDYAFGTWKFIAWN